MSNSDTRHIVSYDNDTLRQFIQVIKAGYDESKKIKIPYNVWIDRASKKITSSPQNYSTTLLEPGIVRYTDTKTMYAQLKSIESETTALNEKISENPSMAVELNKELFELQSNTFKPLQEFYYSGSTEIDGVKSWYASTIKGINVRIGPEGLDLSRPVGFFLSDNTVNANVQGSTGSGKTVMLTEMIFNLSMEFPPWELDLKLIDNKEAELHLFARAAQLPHASVVAATKSKDFLLDLYSSFVEETTMRQELFSATQCNSKENLRKKFNLVLPEVLIIIDEYVAMLLALESTEAMGNQKAGEEKRAIESVLLTLATQSRNAGIHFIISSQDLGSKLNENISKQIHVGATLSGTADIYKGCINNTDVNIDRIGMCIMNLKRMQQDNSEDNKLVGVPFIDSKDKPGELFNDAQKLLIKISDKARELEFKKDFYFYDASIKVSIKKYIEEAALSSGIVANSHGEVLFSVPLGSTISYRNIQTVRVEVAARKGENILYYSTDDKISRYIAQVLVKTITLIAEETKVNVYYTNDEAYRVSELALLDCNANTRKIKLLSADMFEVCENRAMIMRIQELVFSQAKKWDVGRALAVLSKSLSRADVFEKYKNKCESEIIPLLSDNLTEKKMSELLEGIELADKSVFAQFLVKANTICKTRRSNELGDEQRLTPVMFSPILNVWFDPEDIDNIREELYYDRMKLFLSNSTSVNIINVVNSGAMLKTRKLLDEFNYVLECANKDFCMDIDMGKEFIANVNKDSFTVHDRRKSKNTIIKIYGGI